MIPQRKLSVANVLMLLGLAPFLLGAAWVAAGVSYAQQHKGAAGASDAFLMIAVLGITYTFALLVAGPGALWSRRLVRRHAGLRTRAATVMKWLVAIALAAPLLAYAGLALWIYWIVPAG